MNLRTSAELEIVKAIKERACYLSPNPLKEETLDSERAQYSLPDGTQLEVSLYFHRFLGFILFSVRLSVKTHFLQNS